MLSNSQRCLLPAVAKAGRAPHAEPAVVFRDDGLRLIPPYIGSACTFTKRNWQGRSLRDVVQKEFYPISSEHMDRLVQAGRFHIDGRVVTSASVTMEHNEQLCSTVHYHEPPALVTEAQLRSCVVGETSSFLAVNKPASLVVHPTGRFRHNSMTLALMRHLRLFDLSPVHRLDRCASGLLLFAKSSDAARQAFAWFAERRAKKLYVARVANGARLPSLNATFSIDTPLPMRSPTSSALAPAQTLARVVRYDSSSDTALVLCYPVTGRLHQIRLHLAGLGTPIDGDPLHGKKPGASDDNRWLWGVTATGWQRFSRPAIDPALHDPLCPTCQRIGGNAEFDWDDPFARDSVLSVPLHSLRLTVPGELDFRTPLPAWCEPFTGADELAHLAQSM
jgi:RluA family pseudouridine synthase